MVMVKTRKIMRRKIPVFKVYIEQGASYSQLTELPEIQQIVREEAICAIKDGIEKKKASGLWSDAPFNGIYIEKSSSNIEQLGINDDINDAESNSKDTNNFDSDDKKVLKNGGKIPRFLKKHLLKQAYDLLFF